MGVVKLWQIASGNELPVVSHNRGAVRAVAFSGDGAFLAVGGEGRAVTVHNLITGAVREFSASAVVNDLAFSPDGCVLAAVTDAPESLLRLWNIETGRDTTWLGHSGNIHGLAFSPTDGLLATSADDGTVRLWKRDGDGNPVKTIGPGPFGGAVRSLAFTPDGRYLATANANGFVYLLRTFDSPK
jgi:WD40 repeat protein